jgi:hypothetical protein
MCVGDLWNRPFHGILPAETPHLQRSLFLQTFHGVRRSSLVNWKGHIASVLNMSREWDLYTKSRNIPLYTVSIITTNYPSIHNELLMELPHKRALQQHLQEPKVPE